MWAISERDVFCFAIRALVAAHFIYEFVVKVFNFYQVRDTIAAAGMPVATLQLLLVLFLLTVGITLLLIGKWLKVAAVALILFQVPTTAVFEGDWYTRFDSIRFCFHVPFHLPRHAQCLTQRILRPVSLEESSPSLSTRKTLQLGARTTASLPPRGNHTLFSRFE